MGQIAEEMLSGICCEMCGEYLDQEDQGYPMYCSIQCAKDRGADKSQVIKKQYATNHNINKTMVRGTK